MVKIEYAIYKGDSFQFIGSARECASRLDVKPSFIQWLTTPSGKKHFESRKDKSKALTAVKLKDGD
ncbi:hypothetical protein JZO73_10225 [Enterococcus plantarum]|uniref:hypothetical protein n=1 Tax=Enterococcus plantarum TaxID=1077675 RepID=UPI001A8F86CF|nr:hypothetical protein [Enterococcus plantarum]MBO0467906.1 hypothetical protein [Enterococcus plantarum]